MLEAFAEDNSLKENLYVVMILKVWVVQYLTQISKVKSLLMEGF
jgi:hypothetical protein